MQAELLLFFGLLFIVAFLYSSVGHGGASGYLALMALFVFSPSVMKPTALILNLFVSSVSFIQFYRAGHFKWKIFWPFALASIPLSFLGGTMVIDSIAYKKILGILLLFPVSRFLFFKNIADKTLKERNLAQSFLIGGIIGLLSGMIGIGGGIILSPILLLLIWTDQKQTAAISAAFIFANSVAALGGQLIQGITFNSDMIAYAVVAFTGGLLGAYFGASKFPQNILKNMLACVLALAVYKLLFTHA